MSELFICLLMYRVPVLYQAKHCSCPLGAYIAGGQSVINKDIVHTENYVFDLKQFNTFML